MADSNLEKAFDSDGNGEKRNLRVYLINPPSENPWRTQGDYRQEQEEARNRHAMFQEQHQIILKSYRTNLIAVVAAVVAALAAVVIAYLTYQSIPEKQSIEKQQEESLQKPTTNKTK
jgi:hypothetical protein